MNTFLILTILAFYGGFSLAEAWRKDYTYHGEYVDQMKSEESRRISVLERTVFLMKREAKLLHLKNSNLLEEMGQLKNDVLAHKNENAFLVDAVNDLKKSIHVIENQNLQLFQEMRDVQNKLPMYLQEDIGRFVQPEVMKSTFATFTATPSQVRDYDNGDRVLFDIEVVNYGNYYDQSESMFVCPLSGFYLFSLTILADYQSLMMAQIVLDGAGLVTARAGDENTFDSATNLVVALCQGGQSVYIMAYGNNNMKMNNLSSFSGTILRIL